MLRICFLVWLVAWLFICLAGAVGNAWGDTGLANERQQLSGHHYETQWRVDCRQAQRDWLAWHDKPNSPVPATLTEALRLCGIIYNTEDNHRYRTCPNFSAMAQYISTQPHENQTPTTLSSADKHCAQTPLE